MINETTIITPINKNFVTSEIIEDKNDYCFKSFFLEITGFNELALAYQNLKQGKFSAAVEHVFSANCTQFLIVTLTAFVAAKALSAYTLANTAGSVAKTSGKTCFMASRITGTELEILKFKFKVILEILALPFRILFLPFEIMFRLLEFPFKLTWQLAALDIQAIQLARL